VNEEMQVPIRSDQDIVVARQKGRELASSLGFSACDATLVATAISELARNIVLYAKSGKIHLLGANQKHKRGIVVVAQDEGPGIANVHQAVESGFSTSGGLGLGLPGVRRLMDEFEIVSQPGQGTKVTAKKWLP
jgi:serine/threonine-protein kinase RsbT